MSFQALHRAPGRSARPALDAVHGAPARRRPAEGSVLDGSVPEVGHPAVVLGEIDRAIRRLQGLRLRVIAEADEKQVADDPGMSSTSAWVAARSRTSGADAFRTTSGRGGTGRRARRDEVQRCPRPVVDRARQVIATTAARLPERWPPRSRHNGSRPHSWRRASGSTPSGCARWPAGRWRWPSGRSRRPTRMRLSSWQPRSWRGRSAALRSATTTMARPPGISTVPRTAADILKKVVQQLALPKRLASRGAGAR